MYDSNVLPCIICIILDVPFSRFFLTTKCIQLPYTQSTLCHIFYDGTFNFDSLNFSPFFSNRIKFFFFLNVGKNLFHNFKKNYKNLLNWIWYQEKHWIEQMWDNNVRIYILPNTKFTNQLPVSMILKKSIVFIHSTTFI